MLNNDKIKIPGKNTSGIETTDPQIDALVYELYGLTEEAIGIVEGM